MGTLRNWEQGLAEPNAQAKLLLKMVEVDGGILKQLAEITTGTAAVQAKYAVNKVAAKRKRVVKKKAAQDVSAETLFQISWQQYFQILHTLLRGQ